jgi:hypothetical protein
MRRIVCCINQFPVDCGCCCQHYDGCGKHFAEEYPPRPVGGKKEVRHVQQDQGEPKDGHGRTEDEAKRDLGERKSKTNIDELYNQITFIMCQYDTLKLGRHRSYFYQVLL